jgi:hypothetical protein
MLQLFVDFAPRVKLEPSLNALIIHDVYERKTCIELRCLCEQSTSLHYRTDYNDNKMGTLYTNLQKASLTSNDREN